MKNAYEKSQSISGKINSKFNLNTIEATDIYDNSKKHLRYDLFSI